LGDRLSLDLVRRNCLHHLNSHKERSEARGECSRHSVPFRKPRTIDQTACLRSDGMNCSSLRPAEQTRPEPWRCSSPKSAFGTDAAGAESVPSRPRSSLRYTDVYGVLSRQNSKTALCFPHYMKPRAGGFLFPVRLAMRLLGERDNSMTQD